MSAALKLNPNHPATEQLSRKPPLGKKVEKPRLVWDNPKVSRGTQKEKRKVSRNGSYGRVLYNWNRYYSPETGRYVTSDPIGLQGGLNTYIYANANPGRFVDPAGLNPGAICLIPGVCPALLTGLTKACAAVVATMGVTAALTGSTPQCSNDDFFDDDGCPPDCEEWRRALNQAFHALQELERIAELDPSKRGSVMLERQRFKAFVKAYERECGPYNEPPSIHDIYTK